MFYMARMQLGFGFAHADVAGWSRRLSPLLRGVALPPPRTPAAQLVKSMISGRTRDAVSRAAFRRLGTRYRTIARLADADAADVAQIIADVTFADAKAGYVVAALRILRDECGGYDLDFLASQRLPEALAFLEHLPGVGRKVSASTLNASTLAMPVMIVDTHVLRVLRRLRAVDAHADYRRASELVTAAMPEWKGVDFLRFHVAAKRLGQTLCRDAMPDCRHCPLAADCPSVSRQLSDANRQ